MTYLVYQDHLFRPQSGGLLGPSWQNYGLIGLWRPEMTQANEIVFGKRWRQFSQINAVPVRIDRHGLFGHVWDFTFGQTSFIQALDGNEPGAGGALTYNPPALSVDCWFNWINTGEPRYGLVSHSPDGNDIGWGSYIETDARVHAFTDRWTQTATSAPIAENEWTHMCFTHPSYTSGRIELYINGQPDGSLTQTRDPSSDDIAFGSVNSTEEQRLFNGQIAQVRIWDRVLDPAEIRALYEAKSRWRTYSPLFWHIGISGVPTISLDIDGLRHTHPVDTVDVTVPQQGLSVEDLRHAHPIDAVAVEANYELFVGQLRHAHAIDEVAIEITTDLQIDALSHTHPIDTVNIIATTAELIDIRNLSHARALDTLLLEVTHSLQIDDLSHAHPVDEVDTQMLMGDATAVKAISLAWIMDAGAELQNTDSPDLDWHVIDCVFNGNSSEIRIDNGTAVIGNAGVRALELLTLGADIDGANGAKAQIAEVRIYKNNMPLNFRELIATTLREKWIQP